MRVRARRVCACIGLPIAELRYTLVPRDDQALKQLISDILDVNVLYAPLNDVGTGTLWHPKTIESKVHGGIKRFGRALK